MMYAAYIATRLTPPATPGGHVETRHRRGTERSQLHGDGRAMSQAATRRRRAPDRVAGPRAGVLISSQCRMRQTGPATVPSTTHTPATVGMLQVNATAAGCTLGTAPTPGVSISSQWNLWQTGPSTVASTTHTSGASGTEQ